MVKRVGTSRRKAKHMFSVPKKEKGKLPVSEFVKKLETGEQVQLNLKPSITKGAYFRRFRGRMGTVVGMQGSCYKVKIKDGGKDKELIVGAVHLRKANAAAAKAE
ncbi:50S ribosomal protein L21e [Candidatus Woesearchaeota archaeon]|nr:50S ribosomal protein L21e [Candidatus Woesearchaeota archaeon]